MATATAKKAATRRPTAKPTTDHSLDHLIPEMRYYDDFVSRTLPGGISDIDLLRYARKTNQNVLLFGPTGPGKTSLIQAYCAVDGIPLATIPCNGALDPNTIFGQPMQDEATGMIKFIESDALRIIRHGGFLYFDEINFAPPKVLGAYHPLFDGRKAMTLLEKGGELVKGHANLQLGAAYNPEYEGTRPLNPAFKNRFSIKVRYGYDRTVEEQLIFSPALIDVAGKLRDAHDNGELDTPVSTNMLMEFEANAAGVSYDFALVNFLNAFSDEERPPVQEVFDVHSDQVKEQIDEMLKLSAS